MNGHETVTVVVPTRARPQSLARCLAALERQTLDRCRFDVVVVVDGEGARATERLLAGTRVRVTVLRQDHAGPAAARNLGASQARGDVLAFTDDDCVPDPGWLDALVSAVGSGMRLVGGRTTTASGVTPYATASQVLLEYLHSASTSRHGAPPFLTSNNLALSRAAFDLLGGFDTSFTRAGGEDRDLCDRWTAAGGALVVEAAAVVRHAPSLGAGAFVRQHVAYGRGACRVHRSRLERGEQRALEGPGFYVGMVLHPFARMPARRAAPVAALVAISQAATAAGYVLERSGR